MSEVGPPLPKPVMPWQFKWKPMISANQFWLYEVKCKQCRETKLSDYQNVQDWMFVHTSDDCRNITKRWSN
jgi:hypothetical protein